MSQGGTVSKNAPVGWVQLEGGYTVRWRRGDHVAHVLGRDRADDHGMAGVVESIPVSPGGWTDLAEIRQVGQRWRRRHGNQQSA